MPRRGLLLLLLLPACTRQTTVVTRDLPAASTQEAAISGVIAAALSEAAAGSGDDTLYAPTADVIVDGRTRGREPGFAGISPGGQVAVSSSRLEASRATAWSLVHYRWVASDGRSAAEGVATFVLGRGSDGQWKIVHVHSSTE